MTQKQRTLKLMAEVQCWAIWDMVDPDNIDPATLPLPKQLVARINRWSDKFDAIYELDKRNFHTNIAFDSKEEEDAFYEEGWAILKQLEEAMPDIDWWYRDKRLSQPVQSRT
ncbi:hypothetical protein [Notoacmeibacter marinus]|uniref:hypothetical protein n=1 Tax=Notoacmeibacter marinus TaxID=1876515 RepID=UPI0013B05990|nr:hypothetical protein [Notoacmeibacter marinus]